MENMIVEYKPDKAGSMELAVVEEGNNIPASSYAKKPESPPNNNETIPEAPTFQEETHFGRISPLAKSVS